MLLKIITGGAHSGKDVKMLQCIKDELQVDSNVIIIIPEQFVYEYDKRLYSFFGAKEYNKIKACSFSKLSLNLIKLYGSDSGEYACEFAKQIAAFKAVQNLKANKSSRYYSKQLDRQGFVNGATELIKELRHGNIKPDVLSSLPLEKNTVLYNKLSDIDKIYKEYVSILAQNNKKDDLTMLVESVAIAKKNNYFKNMVIFIDEFEGFTSDQYEMIKAMLASCKTLYVTLTIGCGPNHDFKLSPFANEEKTRGDITALAHSFNHKVEVLNITQQNFKSKAISYLANNIFNPVANQVSFTDGLNVVCCDDFYEESEYVAATIKRLIVDEGYKYNEIAVVSRQLSDYYSILTGVFDKYEISYFMDTKQNIMQKALVLYLLAALNCVTTKSFKTENILKYIKSPLSGYNTEDISRLEDFCFKYNVEGNMWLVDFVIPGDEDKGYEVPLNDIRQKIITGLMNFKSSCDDADGITVCRAFYKLFKDTGIDRTISDNIIGSIDNENSNRELDIAREYKQLWVVIVKIIKAIYDNIASEKITLMQFSTLFKFMLSNQTIATPPQKLDAVIIATAQRSKLDNIRVVFVIGVNEGIMPFFVNDSGLITNKEKELLRASGINFSKDVSYRLNEERNIVYKAFTTADEKLYISYPLVDAVGSKRRPSQVIKMVENMFSKDVFLNAWELSSDYYCVTKRAAFSRFIENYKYKSSVTMSIRRVLMGYDDYTSKLTYINKATEDKKYSILRSTSKEMFFKGNFNVSPTSLDSYNKCPFAYFCSEGLKIKPVKTAELNAINRGNIVHYCLDKIMSKEKDGTKCFDIDFMNLSQDSIKRKVSMMLYEYKNDYLGGNFGKTASFEVALDNIGKVVYEVILNIQSELNNSEFKPYKFEVDLRDQHGENYYSVLLESGVKLVLKGKIDRVDLLAKDDTHKYIRIIDYKTGPKQLSYSHMYFGISLQMILYLMAMLENNKEYSPLAALYMPAVMPDSSNQREFSANDDIIYDANSINDIKKKDLIKNGIIVRVNDNDVMNQMMDKNYVYIKNRSKADGESDIIAKESFDKLMNFAKDKLCEMADRLLSGDIDAVPTGEKDRLPCSYCEYWSVCGKYNSADARIITSEESKKLKEIISVDESEGDK